MQSLREAGFAVRRSDPGTPEGKGLPLRGLPAISSERSRFRLRRSWPTTPEGKGLPLRGWIPLLALLAGGCASQSLDTARHEFYAGRYPEASATLAELPSGDHNRVLYLMERGTIQQAARDYESSTTDWLEAADVAEALERYSISKGAASLVTNDKALPYRGLPFERELLRAFLAKNYLARSMWDEAAVEGRNVIVQLERREQYPDDAYGRYLSGACLELANDPSGAEVQYRIASGLARGVRIDPATGFLVPGPSEAELAAAAAAAATAPEGEAAAPAPTPEPPPPPPPAAPPGTHQLICFVGMGRSTAEESDVGTDYERAPYAEFYHDGTFLGRSYLLSDTSALRLATWAQMAALKAAKSVTRVVVKESIADAVSEHDQFLGDMLRLLLFSLEESDTRHWETLPRWLEVARMPCPPNLDHYTVRFMSGGGRIVREKTVATEISRNGKLIVSFCRDLP